MNRKAIVALAALLWIGSSAVPAQAQSGGPPSHATVHIVQRGETLFSIARQYGLTADAITHANGIPDPRQIYVGQRLAIPGVEGDASTAATVGHVVQAGDTLAAIARRYHTTWQTLVQVNGLLSPNVIHAGQVIRVPAPQTPAGEEGDSHPAAGGGAVYIVRPDDTLLRIALRYSISPWTLTAIGRIANPALVFPGQELVVPGAGPGLLPQPFSSVQVQPCLLYTSPSPRDMIPDLVWRLVRV